VPLQIRVRYWELAEYGARRGHPPLSFAQNTMGRELYLNEHHSII